MSKPSASTDSTKRAKPRANLFGLTLRGMEELEHFPSSESRDRALDEMGGDIRWWENVLGIVVVAIGVIAMNIALKQLQAWTITNPSRLGRELLDTGRLILCIGAGFLVLRALHRWGVRRDLRQRLIAAGVAICESCGYLLKGLAPDAAVCPECGSAFSPEVRRLIGHSAVPQANDSSACPPTEPDSTQPR